MSTRVTWHGTPEEAYALISALARNCNCEFGPMGVRVSTCSAHRMLMEDQRVLDGLLFARSMVQRLLTEEFTTGSEVPPGS
jgi:hypothetical protein